MNQILNERESEKKLSIIFSKLSLVISIITLSLIVFMISLVSKIPSTIKASEGIPKLNIILPVAIDFFCLLGLIITLISFVKNEKSNWYKWFGGILNIIFFVIIVGLILFANSIHE